jgi:hypothetical protein
MTVIEVDNGAVRCKLIADRAPEIFIDGHFGG